MQSTCLETGWKLKRENVRIKGDEIQGVVANVDIPEDAFLGKNLLAYVRTCWQEEYSKLNSLRLPAGMREPLESQVLALVRMRPLNSWQIDDSGRIKCKPSLSWIEKA